MSGTPLSLILLPVLDCNAACDYCFETKSRVRLPVGDLPKFTRAILDYMHFLGADQAELYWQGGEVLLLGPAWFESADDLMHAEADASGCTFHHHLQSNMIGYGPHWDAVVRRMFNGAVGTSMDAPNAHRRLKNGSCQRYTEVWLEAVTRARDAGIRVSAIAVLHEGSLQIGAREFLRFFTDWAHIDDLQVNLPFPGGPGCGGDALEPAALSRFLTELLDVWTERHVGDLHLAPFAELIDHYLGRPARLPCIWQPNCAHEFVAIDARGDVALCDCWVTSYPQYRFGNVLGESRLSTLLQESQARRAFLDRPVRLMDLDDCGRCPHLSLCHGGCPIRALASKGTIDARDPYCEVYQAVFGKCRDLASLVAKRAAVSPSSGAPLDLAAASS